MCAVQARRPYTPDVEAHERRLPIASVPRRQFTMDQSKLKAYAVELGEGVNSGEESPEKPGDVVLGRKQFKMASKPAAEKYLSKKKALMKKKEREDLEQWFANTGTHDNDAGGTSSGPY